LIELLVVVSIMVTLMAVAIPLMKVGREERRVREAARLVNTYLHTARNHAEETGRPAGVRIERDPNSPQSGVTLRQVETPPPFAGDYTDSRITFSSVTPNGNTYTCAFVFTKGDSPFTGTPALVANGDYLRLNYQGATWLVTNSSSSSFDLTAVNGSATAIPLNVALAFQFVRQPQSSSVPPVQLPAGLVIDLAFSGTDTKAFHATAAVSAATPQPVDIMFSPNGTIDTYICPVGGGIALSPIYLLIGKRDHVPLETGNLPTYTFVHEDQRHNFQIAESFWVMLNPRTGRIMTEPVVPSNDPSVTGVMASRSEAQKALGQGGQ
jgi:Tfp pilus assembly protein FimT